MPIDAIVANMDTVWVSNGPYVETAAHQEQRSALKRFLTAAQDGGYPLLLVSELSAASLNEAISEKLGDDGVTYFSSILSASELGSRYPLALHTLATSAHRVLALDADQRGLAEARNSGVTHCMPLSDILQSDSMPFERPVLSDS